MKEHRFGALSSDMSPQGAFAMAKNKKAATETKSSWNGGPNTVPTDKIRKEAKELSLPLSAYRIMKVLLGKDGKSKTLDYATICDASGISPRYIYWEITGNPTGNLVSRGWAKRTEEAVEGSERTRFELTLTAAGIKVMKLTTKKVKETV